MLRQKIISQIAISPRTFYKITSIALSLISAAFGVISYFNFGSIPLTSICISVTILGLTSFAMMCIVSLESATFNKIIISLTLAFISLNTILILLGNTNISTYFLLNAIIYLALTLIYSDLYPRIRGAFNWINGLVFACFLAILIIKVIETNK